MPRSWLPPEEDILLSCKPALRSVLLRTMPTLVLAGILAVAVWIALPHLAQPTWRRPALLALGSIALARLLWETLVWLSRRYVLTDRRVLSASGVLNRQTRDLPLDRIQNTILDRPLAQRLFAVGTIAVASAGSAWIDLAWVMVAAPADRLDAIRKAQRAATKADPKPDPKPDAHTPPRRLVLGLVGGIGAGKSAAARILGDLGCLVIDSDAVAREVLDRAAVRDELVGWWGDEILDDAGRVDRTKVARIVFSDQSQRQRLETLVHPLVAQERARLIERAPPGQTIVIDAPLLFEAGVDRECDAVIFVDASPEARAARVMDERGWSAQELDRRERSQWPLERKKRSSSAIVQNNGSLHDLRVSVRSAYDRLRHRPGKQTPSNSTKR